MAVEYSMPLPEMRCFRSLFTLVKNGNISRTKCNSSYTQVPIIYAAINIIIRFTLYVHAI